MLGVQGKDRDPRHRRQGRVRHHFFGWGENGRIHKIKEFYDPDSLGGLYGAITEYLGFDMLDGEFKVMGMAPYGDASKYDFSRLAKFENGELVINTDYANVIGFRRYKEKGKGYYFSPKLIEWLGPKREGDIADDPYIHYAASIQALFEKLALEMMDYYLGDIIHETGKVAFAGGCALNVKLNQKIISRPEVKELFVQPAASDAGTAVGAAAYVSHQRGVPVEDGARLPRPGVFQRGRHRRLRPSRGQAAVAEDRQPQPAYRQDPCRRQPGGLVPGTHGVRSACPRWRSILGCPSVPGVADRINAQIKFRERWRPFCPSMLDTVGPQMFKIDHPAPFMTFTFEVNEEWKERVPEVVHEDGTSRAQVLKREYNPRYYDLMKELENLTGNGVALNTSLNRRGEPMICSPTDALNMFFGSDLQYLIMEDILVVKEGVDWYDSVG